MANKKKIKKAIESYQKRIEEHEEKIKTYEGRKDYLKEYWEKEIKELERRKAKKQDKLEK